MSDQAAQQDQTSNDTTVNAGPPPPSGDSKKAEKYISQLIELVDKDRVQINHTDLSRYDPGAMQDHYRIPLKDYHVEVSHSKNPINSVDSYVIIFTNVKVVEANCTEKVILAYMHLDPAQFARFKKSADAQMDKNRKKEEEKRLNAALSPIDSLLDELKTNTGQFSSETVSSLGEKSTSTPDDIKVVESDESASSASTNMPIEPVTQKDGVAQQIASSAI